MVRKRCRVLQIVSLPVMPYPGRRSNTRVKAPKPMQGDYEVEKDPKVEVHYFSEPNPLPLAPPPPPEVLDEEGIDMGSSLLSELDTATRKMQEVVASDGRTPEKLRKMHKGVSFLTETQATYDHAEVLSLLLP